MRRPSVGFSSKPGFSPFDLSPSGFFGFGFSIVATARCPSDDKTQRLRLDNRYLIVLSSVIFHDEEKSVENSLAIRAALKKMRYGCTTPWRSGATISFAEGGRLSDKAVLQGRNARYFKWLRAENGP